MSNQDTQDRFPTIGGRPFGRRAGSARCGTAHHDQRLERLIERLPDGWQKFVRQLRRPSARWARIPAGILLVVAGCLAILPIFGLWMIPLGLFLLAEDVQLLRRLRERTLDWLERRWPHLFAHSHKPAADKEETT